MRRSFHSLSAYRREHIVERLERVISVVGLDRVVADQRAVNAQAANAVTRSDARRATEALSVVIGKRACANTVRRCACP